MLEITDLSIELWEESFEDAFYGREQCDDIDPSILTAGWEHQDVYPAEASL